MSSLVIALIWESATYAKIIVDCRRGKVRHFMENVNYVCWNRFISSLLHCALACRCYSPVADKQIKKLWLKRFALGNEMKFVRSDNSALSYAAG